MADRLREIVDNLDSLKHDFIKLSDAMDHIETIKNEIEELERIIDTIIYNKTEQIGQESLPFESDVTAESPTEAVRKLFKEQPDVKWSPQSIVRHLEKLKKQGALKMKPGRRPDRFIHSILASLKSQGFILKFSPKRGSRDSYYVKNSGN